MEKEKKQVVVLAALFVAILGVGAFQFMAGGEEAPPPAKAEKSEEEKKTDAAKEASKKSSIKNPMVAAALQHRDPFKLAPFALTPEQIQQANKPTTPEQSAPTPPVKPIRNVPPLPPLKGQPVTSGPETGGDLKPFQPEAPRFGYTVAGVIVGQHPAAVFRDASGNERLISLRGSIDADSTVIAITKSFVKVKFHGKTLTLTLGGTSVEE